MAALIPHNFFFACSFIFLCFPCVALYKTVDVARKIHSEYNPGCPSYLCNNSTNGSFPNLVHVEAVGPHDTLHYIASSIGSPAIIVARFVNNVTLSVNWKGLTSGNVSDLKTSITFDQTPLYAYGVILKKLIVYNDVHDKADMSKPPPTNQSITYDLKDFKWSAVTHLADSVVFGTSSAMEHEFYGNGSLSLKMMFPGNSGRSAKLPHLQYNGNSSVVDVVFDKLSTSYKNSRIALELMHLTNDGNVKDILYETDKSIDDEYTPGIFKLVGWTSKASFPNIGSFLQWKPVCYLEKQRSMKVATYVREYKLHSVSQLPYNSVAYAVFGDKMVHYAMKATSVSFGLSDDGFYTGTNYTSWTFTVGYGMRPQEKLSIVIIAVITAGLGIPALIIIFGGIGVCIKRRRTSKDVVYGPINGDPVS